MYKFAVIEQGIVQNIIVAESREIAEEVTGKTAVLAEANVGDFYDDETGEFTTPVIEDLGDDAPIEDPAPAEG